MIKQQLEIIDISMRNDKVKESKNINKKVTKIKLNISCSNQPNYYIFGYMLLLTQSENVI